MKLLSSAYLLSWLVLVPSVAQLHAQITEVAKLLPSSGAGSQWFGWSLSISGDRVLVGSPRHGVLGSDLIGAAYVFERDAGGAWIEVATLQASDGALGDTFGISVSLCGDRALIGAEEDDDLGLESGSAYVFERDAGGTWIEVAKLLASGGAAGDYFGASVSISRNRALVGSWGDNDLGSNSGSATMFERGAGGTWTEVTKLLASDGAAADLFSFSVSVSGDCAFVGSLNDDDLGPNSGSAYVFERDAGGNWTQVAKLLASDGAGVGGFGLSVSVSEDRALVGASGVFVPSGWHGQVYVFERDGGGLWTEVARLMPHDPIYYASFGESVSLSGDRALVGAQWQNGPPFQSGAAYLFGRDPAGTWSQVKLLASDGSYHQRFGRSVSISGNRAFVGAPANADGVAYLFEAVCNAPVAAPEVVRLGSPPNPNALLPGLTTRPVVGSIWDPMIDHTTFLPGAVMDSLGITAHPLNLHLPPFGTLLCDPTLTIATESVPAGVPFAVPIPGDCGFAGVSLCTQGVSVDASGSAQLTNALDITIGTFW